MSKQLLSPEKIHCVIIPFACVMIALYLEKQLNTENDNDRI